MAPRRNCRDYERLWQDRIVDKNLLDEWLYTLNSLQAFDLISICEGHLTTRRQYPNFNLKLKQHFQNYQEFLLPYIKELINELEESNVLFSWEQFKNIKTQAITTKSIFRISSRRPRISEQQDDILINFFNTTLKLILEIDKQIITSMNDQNIHYYFAYGSNMNLERITQRLGYLPKKTCGRIINFNLVFNKISQQNANQGFANIETHPGSTVYGVIYYLNEPSDIELIDKYEGFPEHYFRIPIIIYDSNCLQYNGWVYLTQSHWKRDNLYPSRKYLMLLLSNSQLPDSYRKYLLNYLD